MYYIQWFGVWWHHNVYNKEHLIYIPYWRKWLFFYTDWKQYHLYVEGVTSIFLLEKGTYKCLEIPYVHLRLKKNDIKNYFTNILKSETSSGDTNEKVDHRLDYFEKFNKKYIIMPSKSLNYLFLEESLFVTVQSPPGFINQENKTRFYLNATLQLLYLDVLFRQLVLNIDCYTMLNGQGKNSTFCS